MSSAGQVYAGSTADASGSNAELFIIQNTHLVEVTLNMHSGQLGTQITLT